MGRPRLTDEQKRQNRMAREKKNKLLVKPEQVNVCQFVTIEVQTFERNSIGKWERTGSIFQNGLQYENQVLLLDGTVKFLNSSSVRLSKVYQIVPPWATAELLSYFTRKVFNGEIISFS